MPTLRSFAMDKNELQVAEFLRLGHPLPFSYCISYCNRSAELDAEDHHVSLGEALYGNIILCQNGASVSETYNRIIRRSREISTSTAKIDLTLSFMTQG